MESLAIDRQPKPVKVNRLAIILLVVAGTVVGMLPMALWLDRLWVLLLFAAEAAIMAFFSVRKFRSPATEMPGPAEFLLGGLGAVFMSSTYGFMWLVVYGIVAGVVGGLAGLVRLVGVSWHPDGAGAAYPVSLVLIALLYVGTAWVAAEDLSGQLYPKLAGLRSAYYGMVTRRGRRLIVTYGLVGLAYVGLVVAIVTTHWSLLALVAVELLMIFSTMTFSEPSQTESILTNRVIRAVRKLFESAAYEIVPVPSSGDPSIDPLLASVDIVARNSQREFAVRVLASDRAKAATAGQKKPPDQQAAAVEWGEASALQTAAWALSSISGSVGLPARTVEPLLVLAGVAPSDGLRAFCQDQAVRMVEIDMDTVTRIQFAEPADELRAMAAQYLGLTAASGPGAAGQEAGQSA